MKRFPGFFHERFRTLIPGGVVFGVRLTDWDFLGIAQADHDCRYEVQLTWPMRYWNLHNWRFGFRVCCLPKRETRRKAEELARRVAVPVFEDRVWHSAGPQMVEGPIVYFENAGGDELACWTVGINRLQVFNEPREVHPSMRSGKTLWTRPPVASEAGARQGE